MSTTALDSSLTDPASFRRTTVTDDDSDSWPPEPTVITHVLSGALASRVRARMGLAARDKVTLIETTVYGGYSEYTQENSTDFEVNGGARRIAFYPHSGTSDFRADVGNPYSDSVFARFDAWLSVAERPLELFNEWFSYEDEGGSLVRYRANGGTILARALRERKYAMEHANLDGRIDGSGRSWTLDLIAKKDERDFARVLERNSIGFADGLVISESAARDVLEQLTDFVMPGRAY